MGKIKKIIYQNPVLDKKEGDYFPVPRRYDPFIRQATANELKLMFYIIYRNHNSKSFSEKYRIRYDDFAKYVNRSCIKPAIQKMIEYGVITARGEGNARYYYYNFGSGEDNFYNLPYEILRYGLKLPKGEFLTYFAILRVLYNISCGYNRFGAISATIPASKVMEYTSINSYKTVYEAYQKLSIEAEDEECEEDKENEENKNGKDSKKGKDNNDNKEKKKKPRLLQIWKEKNGYVVKLPAVLPVTLKELRELREKKRKEKEKEKNPSLPSSSEQKSNSEKKGQDRYVDTDTGKIYTKREYIHEFGRETFESALKYEILVRV